MEQTAAMTTIASPLGASRPPISRAEGLVMAVLILSIIVTRLHNHLLFHVLIETCNSIIMLTAFSLSWNTRNHLEDGFLKIYGLAAGPVVVLTILHTIAYQGMGVFPEYGANLPTQLWSGQKILQAGWALAATFPVVVQQSSRLIMSLSAVLSGTVIALIFTDLFPDCFVPGSGLTRFKVAVEYVSMLALAIATWRFYRDSYPRDPRIRQISIVFLAVCWLQGLTFTAYTDTYGVLNVIGHVLGLISALLLYAVIAWRGLAVPQAALYARLDAERETLEEDAGRANDDITRFSEILAHHLQEPVRQQLVYCQMLGSVLPTPLTAEAQNALDLVTGGAYRLRALLHDAQVYLSLSQDDASPTLSDGDQAMDRAIKHLAAKIQQTNTVIRCDPLPRLPISSKRLAEMFIELIDNGMDYARPDSHPEITISSQSRGGQVEITVSDNGIGIPPEYRDRVFRIFERLTPLDNVRGTGIGLAVVRRIVEDANGRIRIQDNPGGGTMICLSIPAINR